MFVQNKTKQVIDLLASRVSLFALGLITVWMGASVAKEAYRKYQVQQEIAHLKTEIIGLEQENNNLASLIGSFSDPSNIEAEAKKRLNLKKPGEEVAVILRDKNDETQNIVQRKNEVSAPSVLNGSDATVSNSLFDNPAKWWRYITDSSR